MKGTIHKRPKARQDLIDIYRRYAREAGLTIADRFFTESEATFRSIAVMPGIGTRYEAANPAFGELRYFPLPSPFKLYLVFYRPIADGIEVVRVLHGSRDIQGILAADFGVTEQDDDDGGAEEYGH